MLTVVVPAAPPPPTRAAAGDPPSIWVSRMRVLPAGDGAKPMFVPVTVSTPAFAARVRLATVTVVGAAPPAGALIVPLPTTLTVPRAWTAGTLLFGVKV